MALQRVNSHTNQYTINETFFEPFNQCTFFNYDTVNPVEINKLRIPPAIVNAGNVYPASYQVSLNVGEVNDSKYQIDFKGSTSANLFVVYTQYLDQGLQ